jgi:hypothetical protein
VDNAYAFKFQKTSFSSGRSSYELKRSLLYRGQPPCSSTLLACPTAMCNFVLWKVRTGPKIHVSHRSHPPRPHIVPTCTKDMCLIEAVFLVERVLTGLRVLHYAEAIFIIRGQSLRVQRFCALQRPTSSAYNTYWSNVQCLEKSMQIEMNSGSRPIHYIYMHIWSPDQVSKASKANIKRESAESCLHSTGLNEMKLA